MKTKVIIICLLCLIAKTKSNAQSASYDQYVAGLWPNDNCAFGAGVMAGNPSAVDNTGTGYRAMNTGLYWTENCANGAFSLFTGMTSPFPGTNANTAVGFQSLYSTNSGTGLSAIGSYALYSNTTGSGNVANGVGALYSNTKGFNNTASGYRALYSAPSGGGCTNNTAVGHSALTSNDGNGNENTAVGKDALTANTLGYGNSAMGYRALASNNSWGLYNTAIGCRALAANISGGDYNFALGADALAANTTGWNNTAVGLNALQNNSTAADNTAIGVNAMQLTTTGGYNLAIGGYALKNCNSYNNTAVGTTALASITSSGHDNVAMGALAGECFQFGGSGTPDKYCSFFGGYSGITATYGNAAAVGWFTAVNANDKIRLGDVNVTTVETQVAPSVISDGRFKFNVNEEGVKGLDFITRLRPVVYNFDKVKYAEFITKNAADSIKRKYLANVDKESMKLRQSGFIAQEVEQAAQEAGYNFDGVLKPSDENGNYGVAYGKFVVPLTKAVQEQQVLIEQQQMLLDDMSKTAATHKKAVNDLQSLALNDNQANGGDRKSVDLSFDATKRELTIKSQLSANERGIALTLYDLSGKKISSYPVEGSNVIVDLGKTQLGAGIYLCSVTSDNKLLGTKTLVVLEN